jgi:hypothetical protein
MGISLGHPAEGAVIAAEGKPAPASLGALGKVEGTFWVVENLPAPPTGGGIIGQGDAPPGAEGGEEEAGTLSSPPS